MNTSEAIADMLQQEGGPCVLDKIHLPYGDPTSGPAAKFGLGAELYLPDINRAVMRQRVCSFLRDYWSLFPQRVDQFLARDTRRTIRFQGDPGDLIKEDLDRYPAQTGYSASLFGHVDIELPKDDIHIHQAQVLALRHGDRDLSFVYAAMPVCRQNGDPYIDLLLDSVLKWAQICQPTHGSAGLSFVVSSGMSQNSVYALQMMKRFPGFDFPAPIDFTMEAGPVHNRIKCVNWLTVLSDALIEELGGLSAARAVLEPSCTLHDYEGGVVIQAGPHPRLGDTLLNDVPAEYRLVARYTQPIRFEHYEEGLFQVPKTLDGRQEALAWVRRFD